MLSGKWVKDKTYIQTPTAKTAKTPISGADQTTIGTSVSSVSGGLDIQTRETNNAYIVMTNAIVRIKAVYDPGKVDAVIEKRLAAMPLETIGDIFKWEAAWLNALEGK